MRYDGFLSCFLFYNEKRVNYHEYNLVENLVRQILSILDKKCKGDQLITFFLC